MSNFSQLKKSSGFIDRLNKEIEKINSGGFAKEEDTRFWYPELDKAGNGSALIRFLPGPAADGDDALPWVRIFKHGFKGPTGKWYIENSLTTIDKKDPVGTYNSELWNKSTDDDSPERKQARDQRRKLTYIANIYIINDPRNPENNGQIKLFRFGKKIFDKINSLLSPEFEGDERVNVFDFWKGRNFRLKIRKVAGQTNYDLSAFEDTSSVLDNLSDDKLEEIWNKEYPLLPFVAPDQFKSYDELKKRLDAVLGTGTVQVKSPRQVTEKETDTPPWEDRAIKTHAAEDEDEDELAAFRKLAED